MVNGNVTTLGPRKSRDKEGVANPSIFISMVSPYRQTAEKARNDPIGNRKTQSASPLSGSACGSFVRPLWLQRLKRRGIGSFRRHVITSVRQVCYA